MKVILSAGGTMGHINPVLAILDEIKKHENVEVLYIGTTNRMEKDIIPNLNIKYEGIEIYGLSKNIIRDIKNVYLIHKGIKRCLKIMKEFKPDIVITSGGYVTFPVVYAASKLNIKTFIHEQNSIPGKANLLVSKYADKIGVTFKSSLKYFKNNNALYTGNPVSNKAIETKEIKRETLGLSNNKKLVTIVAGSLGSYTLNNIMKDYLKEAKDYQIVYITGKSHYKEFNEEYPSNVLIIPYMDNLPALFKTSDLVISRAGSGALSELMALKKVSVIIPSPYVANNHQYYNALELYEDGCIDMLDENTLNKDILNKKVDLLLNNNEERNKLISNMNKLESSNKDIIYKIIKDMLNE